MSLSTAFVVTPECMSGATRSRKSSSATEVETRRAHELAHSRLRSPSQANCLPVLPRSECSLQRPLTRPAASLTLPIPPLRVEQDKSAYRGSREDLRGISPPFSLDYYISVIQLSKFLAFALWPVLLPVVRVTNLHPFRSLVNSFRQKFQRPRVFPGGRLGAFGSQVCERAPTGRASPPDSVRSVLSCSCHYSTTNGTVLTTLR